MSIRLIADAGSTKIDWALVDNADTVLFTTEGLNALTTTDDELATVMSAALACAGPKADRIKHLHWYGAGCATEDVCCKLRRSLSSFFPTAEIDVDTDLKGAAIALFGDADGIACILGTGSNSGLYRGGKIIDNVPPLGYILGDEGSGASLGRRLVRSALRQELPDEVADTLRTKYGIDKAKVLEMVYRKPGGARWLASLTPALAEMQHVPEVRALLTMEFADFFMRCIDLYPESRMYSLGFVGGVAWHFADELQRVAESMGYRSVKILRTPIDGMAEYFRR